MGVALGAAFHTRPVLVLELNELCPPIIERMMAAGELPNFSALAQRSETFVTHTADETLEPWVQWPSFHTGRPETVHGAKELDEGHLIETRRIWDDLAEAGLDSLIFGSMNGDSTRRDKVYLVPDPWSAGVRPTDPAFEDFHRFISFHVAEHTNPNARPGKKDAVDFAAFMLKNGLSFSTLFGAASQIISERTSSVDRKWRRALILDLIMWDAFAHNWTRRQPKFATFFANSTAFLQHRYWRHMQPEAYQVKPSDEEMASYGDAIEDSYRHMDRLVGRARRLVGPEGRLVLATGLSQEANTRYEHIGGKFVYRAHSFADVFSWAGGPQPVSFEPVMTHQAWATFASEADAIAAESTLAAIQSNGRTIMEWRRTGNRVMFWCGLISKVEPGFEVTNANTGARKAFDSLFMLVGQVNNSQHSRDGVFWMETGGSTRLHHDGKLPLEEAHGLMLGLFGLTPPQELAAAE